jgi:hypothetical protein
MSETLENQEPQMSVEEMKQRRDEITAYYQEEIPHLKIKADYEELINRIEKARFERTMQQLQMAQIMAPPPEDENNKSGTDFDIDKMTPPSAPPIPNKVSQEGKTTPKAKRTLKKA